jgi:hypothetical protein
MRASRSSGSSSPESSVATSMPLMKLDLFGAAYQDQDQDSVCAITTATSTNASSQQPSEAASSVPPRLLPLRSVGKLPPQQGAIGGRSMCATRSPAHEQPLELARVAQWKLELMMSADAKRPAAAPFPSAALDCLRSPFSCSCSSWICSRNHPDHAPPARTCAQPYGGLLGQPPEALSECYRDAASVCVFITAVPITKLFAGGGGGYWSTCAMRDDKPRPV